MDALIKTLSDRFGLPEETIREKAAPLLAQYGGQMPEGMESHLAALLAGSEGADAGELLGNLPGGIGGMLGSAGGLLGSQGHDQAIQGERESEPDFAAAPTENVLPAEDDALSPEAIRNEDELEADLEEEEAEEEAKARDGSDEAQDELEADLEDEEGEDLV